jgi:hypothetical protein
VNTATKKPEPIPHTMTIEIEIDPTFIECLVDYSEVFRRDHSGYWAYGMQVTGGWLLYEREDGPTPTDKECAEVLRTYRVWRNFTHPGKPDLALPKKWHLLDRAVAIRAWEEGVKRWGVNWYDNVDGPRKDVVVQLALLGEVKYG